MIKGLKLSIKNQNCWSKDQNCRNLSKMTKYIKNDNQNNKIMLFLIKFNKFWSNSNSDSKSVSQFVSSRWFCLYRTLNSDRKHWLNDDSNPIPIEIWVKVDYIAWAYTACHSGNLFLEEEKTFQIKMNFICIVIAEINSQLSHNKSS